VHWNIVYAELLTDKKIKFSASHWSSYR